MSSPLPTRHAVAADAAELTALVNSAYRGASSRRGWTTEADLLGGQRTDFDAITELISEPHSAVLLHEAGGRIVACVNLARTDRGCYLGMFTVAPDLQSAGLGRRLLETAERFAAREWNCSAMFMTVIVQRLTLIAWYERRGYRRTGEHRPFPYGDEKFGVPLRPDLEFEVLRKDLALCGGSARRGRRG